MLVVTEVRFFFAVRTFFAHHHIITHTKKEGGGGGGSAPQWVGETIRRLKEEDSCDVVIVSPHWGPNMQVRMRMSGIFSPDRSLDQ